MLASCTSVLVNLGKETPGVSFFCIACMLSVVCCVRQVTPGRSPFDVLAVSCCNSEWMSGTLSLGEGTATLISLGYL